MPRSKLKPAWYASPYTGLFVESGPVPREAHDPDVSIWSGVAPLPDAGAEPPAGGGAGWDDAEAEAAGVGEAIERWQSWPLPCDRTIEASFRDWPLDEPAVAPGRWVLFHPEQYALPGFPYRPFTPATVCRWVCCRQAISGLPHWVPEELVYLSLPPGRFAQLCPLVSSGMACGRWGQPVLLRGLQEVIERDAVVGAAWGSYPLTEIAPERVFAGLDPALPPRLLRSNLRYRCYRVGTPFSAHMTVVTLEGEDREGYCFSIGAACRQTRTASWTKSLLEAVQGRHYVRYLKSRFRREGGRLEVPASFADHALYYSVYPERLAESALGRKPPPPASFPLGGGPGAERLDTNEDSAEDLAALADRLGPERPVLFRNLTPPGMAMERLDWYVLRVVVPGLQPLHGHHALPFLGGPLWAPRGYADWANMPPHPFP
jgi:ribosomal protein S12 methylthiotransferase accessory factor